MPVLELSEAQVVDLVKQLSPKQQRAALVALASGAQQREATMQFAESQLRRISAERGLNWDEMSDVAREDFVDDLLHEDRSCER
jgi:hypothetical protein